MKQDRSQSGSAAVEFALILPIIALLCCGLADYGHLVNLSSETRSAARAAAQYALAHPADTNGIQWAAQHATKETSTDLTISFVTSSDGSGGTLPYYCTCTDGDPGATKVNCVTETCATGTKKFFVSVTASQPYTAILPYPGLVSSASVTGVAIIQVQ